MRRMVPDLCPLRGWWRPFVIMLPSIVVGLGEDWIAETMVGFGDRLLVRFRILGMLFRIPFRTGLGPTMGASCIIVGWKMDPECWYCSVLGGIVNRYYVWVGLRLDRCLDMVVDVRCRIWVQVQEAIVFRAGGSYALVADCGTLRCFYCNGEYWKARSK